MILSKKTYLSATKTQAGSTWLILDSLRLSVDKTVNTLENSIGNSSAATLCLLRLTPCAATLSHVVTTSSQCCTCWFIWSTSHRSPGLTSTKSLLVKIWRFSTFYKSVSRRNTQWTYLSSCPENYTIVLSACSPWNLTRSPPMKKSWDASIDASRKQWALTTLLARPVWVKKMFYSCTTTTFSNGTERLALYTECHSWPRTTRW